MISSKRGGLGTHGPSPVRWAGSKRHVVAKLVPMVADTSVRYVEPFAGSAALFFAAQPKRATLGDLNHHLINFYEQLRCNHSRLHRELANLSRTKREYLAVRKRFNSDTASAFRQAVYFAFLNRNCFNGIWRTNQEGEFNVPYAAANRSEYPTRERYKSVAEALKNVTLYAGDFRQTLNRVHGKALIYADPPYFSTKERVFVEYGEQSFGQSDLDDLVTLLKRAAHKGARVIVSYKSGEGLPEKLSGWHRRDVLVTRNVGGFAGTRKTAREVVLSNHSLAQLD